MTDTFQGGKGAFRKDRKINMKESRHRKEEQKRNVFTFSLDYIKESGRQLSDLCPTAGKRSKKNNHFVTSGKQESDLYLTNENPETKADWLAWLQQWLVDWGKSIFGQGENKGSTCTFKAKILEEKLTESGWLTERSVFDHRLTLNWCAPKKYSQTRVDWQAWQQWLVDWKKAWVHFYCQPSSAAASPYIRHSQLQNNQELPGKSDWYKLMHQK